MHIARLQQEEEEEQDDDEKMKNPLPGYRSGSCPSLYSYYNYSYFFLVYKA
jgi:hypothetical protein